MPYLIVYRPDKNWLVVIEAVTGHGPVDPKRRAQVGVADLEHGQVVPERRLQGGLAKAEAPQPPVMGDGPLVASSPHLTVAEQELRQSVSGPGAVGDGVVPRPAKIPHGSLGFVRFVCTVQSRKPSRSSSVPLSEADDHQRKADF